MEADCLDTAGNSLIASMLFHDSDEDNSDNDNDNSHNTDDCDTFELLALHYLSEAAELAGDGTRGPYNQAPKSTDFFDIMMTSPDRTFRHLVREQDRQEVE